MIAFDVSKIDFDKGNGLVCAVVQDWLTLQVLMVAWMNRDALDETLQSGEATFFSRSRNERWRKGETSRARLKVKTIVADCDGDTLLVSVEPLGPACHLGTTSCFGTETAPGVGRLGVLERTIAERADADPNDSWTAKLLGRGVKRIAQKVGEEGVETALAGAAGDDGELCEESADLLYHLTLLLKARGVSVVDVMAVLARRADARP
jgi:phosphoribosyl-AMP cyclohydrolase / phosphoribosyl-ATP pyrophosphohydrolase